MRPEKGSTYRIEVAYDGIAYSGWQRQPQRKTIQGCIEEALARIVGKRVSVIGAGRTDAGVHARAQVAHFKASVGLEDAEFLRALNAHLPKDIRIVRLKKAEPDFHARKHAVSKVYEYRIFNHPDISPFLIRYALHVPEPLDVERMQDAAKRFVREADFTPFSSNRLLHPVRKVMDSEVRKKGRDIFYRVEANGFLRYMVRTMVGALLEIGKGKYPPEIIDEIFEKGERTRACPTAPPHGLCLIKVNYGGGSSP